MNKTSDTTHFGYQEIPTGEKTRKVAEVFDTVANRYDLMNDLMSLGIHRLWKQYTVQMSGVRAGQQILDIAGGTGDLAKKFKQQVGPSGRVTIADINANMLAVGRNRLTNQGLVDNLDYVQADAENLPFVENQFDCVSIAFGLRNVTRQAAAIQSILRVLKPGGVLLVLEFSQPIAPGLKPIYDLYSFKILPRLGEWIADSADSYRYLVESIRKHPDQETLKKMILDAGFALCDYYNLTGGIVCLHRAYKA